MKQTAQQLRSNLKLINSRLHKAPITSAYSAHRRVTVENVFDSAGKRDKNGNWVPHAVSVIGSGLGQRIYPPERPGRRHEPAAHRKEYLWRSSFDRRGEQAYELVIVRNCFTQKMLERYEVQAFRTGRDEDEFTRLVNDKYGTRWVDRI